MNKNLIDLIKKLRTTTQAGYADCKAALIETNNDFEKAIEWLKKKGIAKAIKKAGAIATDGVTFVKAYKDHCVLFELNCQTDFVAKNELYVAFYNEIADAFLENKTTSDFENVVLKDGSTLSDKRLKLSAQFGEKIALRRVSFLTKKAHQTFGIYQHANNKVSAVVLLDTQVDPVFAKELAMHLAAMKPLYIDVNSVDPAWKAKEKEIAKEKAIAEKKPAQFIEKIAEGTLNKLLAEVCFVEQKFFKEQNTKVKQLLKNHQTKIVQMLRYELGEGI